MSALVTGEAVVLELRLARLPSRALGLAVDLITQLGLLFFAGMIMSPAFAEAEEALSAAAGLVVLVGVLVGYPVAFETLTRGRSLGKMALGLRVVRDDGGPIRFRHSLVRGLLGVVEFYVTFGSAALLSSLISPEGKRLGDLLAGTVVVRERMPVTTASAVAMPPALARWASTLDLAGLPEEAVRQAREVLMRWYDLAPPVRQEMASRLAAAIAATVSPAPPPNVPTWAYLAAVLAERHRRELARMGPPQVQPPFQGAVPPGHQPPPAAVPKPWGAAGAPVRAEPPRPDQPGGFRLPG